MVYFMVCTPAIIVLLYILRCALAFRYSKACIHRIYELGIIDINLETPNFESVLEQRWEKLEKVSFNDLCNKFWRPLRSFYKDEDFT